MKKSNKLIRLLLIIIATITLVYYIFNDPRIDRILIILTLYPVVYLPVILNKFFKIGLTDELEMVYLIFIFMAHYLGAGLEFYNKFPGLDKITHFISGIVSGFFALFFLKKARVYQKHNHFFNILFIISFAFMVAGLWEIFEFTISKIMGTDPQHVITTGIDDTMFDSIAAFGGSLLVVLYYQYYDKKGK